MPLSVRAEASFFIPTIICDHCSEPISNAHEGNYQFRAVGEGDRQVFFIHKACCLVFEANHPGLWLAVSLEVLPMYLAKSLGVDPERAKEQARIHAARFRENEMVWIESENLKDAYRSLDRRSV